MKGAVTVPLFEKRVLGTTRLAPTDAVTQSAAVD
jgi:hypothetical protein